MSCDRRLQVIFLEVVKHVDCTVIEGTRTEAKQQKLYKDGLTTTLNSKHLKRPSQAVDVVPYPLNWKRVRKDDPYELRKYVFLAGFVFAVAVQHNVIIRWGGAWKQRYVLNDPGDFQDLAHYELAKSGGYYQI